MSNANKRKRDDESVLASNKSLKSYFVRIPQTNPEANSNNIIRDTENVDSTTDSSVATNGVFELIESAQAADDSLTIAPDIPDNYELCPISIRPPSGFVFPKSEANRAFCANWFTSYPTTKTKLMVEYSG